MKLLATVLAACTLCVASCQSDERTKGWNADLDHYVLSVKRDHYVYSKQELPVAFVAQEKFIRKEINSLSDQRLLFEFEKLAATLGDGHTYILPWSAQLVNMKALPFRFYLFSDGLYIIDAKEGFSDYIGSRVDQLGSVGAGEAMKRIAPFVSRDSDMGINWIGPVFLSFQGALDAIGAKPDHGAIRLTLSGENGKTEKSFSFEEPMRMRGVPKLIPSRIASEPSPLYLSNAANYWVRSLQTAKGKQLYFQFNQVWNADNESLAAFSARLADSIAKTKPVHLIIDVRHNNGGNADLLDPLLNVLKNFRKDPDSRLTIITGRNTFSACQIFIARADVLVHPTFAGEASSSKPNFVGEEHEVILPYCGAFGSISNRYHESIPGDKRESIPVNVAFGLSSADYFANRDPVLQAVLEMR